MSDEIWESGKWELQYDELVERAEIAEALAASRLKSLNVWKEAAKKWRKLCQEIPSVSEFMHYKKLAASRLELIKEVDKQLKICPICHGILSWIGDVKPPNAGHADNCKWAKELGDD